MFVSGHPTSAGRTARGMTLTELLVIIAIIGVVLAVAVPSFSTLFRDMSTSKARSDVFAALTAARSRAITSRNLVALHVFLDGPAYAADRRSTDPTQVDYDRSDRIRWGINLASTYGIPHVPTNKLVMRLEVPYRPDTTNNATEFVWPADHEPVVLPDSLRVANPGTEVGAYVDLNNEIAGARAGYLQDFYIVFGEDGKVVTTLVDYNLNRTDNTLPVSGSFSSTGVEEVVNGNGSGPDRTWSSAGLSIYDRDVFESMPTPAQQMNYINRADNVVMLSAYTGLPLEGVMR
jgi:type II secretory pathway pseudopilin PulG